MYKIAVRSMRPALVLMAAAALSGCMTDFSRGLGRLTDNKYADARSGSVWVVAPPQLEPPAQKDKSVYISFRNISDAQNIDLRGQFQKAAQEQGWNLVTDPQKARYRLRASLRFFGEVEPETGGMAVARGMGGIAGAAIGVGTYALVSNAANSRTAGAVGGALAGGLVAAGMANSSRPREWAMVLDIVLEEYSAKAVEFELMTDSGSGTQDSAGTGNSRMASGGGSRAGNSSSAAMKKKSNYFPHGVRLSAWANQMNMNQDEALPLLQGRIETVAAQILPQ